MTAFKDFRTYEYTVAANSEREVNTTGTYFAVLEADGAFRVALGDMPSTEFEAGLKVRLPDGVQFSKVTLINETGSPVTIKFNVGFGDFVDGRFVLSGGIDLSKSSDLLNFVDKAIGAGATAQIAGADNSRRELIISNPATSLGAIRVGRTGSTGATSGVWVEPGTSIILTTTQAVNCHNPTAASINVAALGVLD